MNPSLRPPPLSKHGPSGVGVLVCAMLLASCATDDVKPNEYGLSLRADTALQRNPPATKSFLEGGLKFRAPDSLFNYDADYALKPGASLLLPPASLEPANVAVAPETLIAGESFGQRVKAQLPFFEAPLVVGAQDRYQGLLTPQGLTAARTAQLSWSPSPAKLGLQWSNLNPATAQPFDCGLGGSIDVPGRVIDAGANDNLRLSGRGCRVIAPDRGIANLAVNSYSAAWQWRGGAGDSAVQLTVIEPLRSRLAAATSLDAAPSYELNASRAQTRGGVTAKASVAVRRAGGGSTNRGGEPLNWSARTTLSRQFRDVAVSASLQHAADPLWFVPASASGGNSAEIGFDFRRWIEQKLATRKVGLGLTWSWIEPPIASQPIDRRVLWKFSLTP